MDWSDLKHRIRIQFMTTWLFLETQNFDMKSQKRNTKVLTLECVAKLLLTRPEQFSTVREKEPVAFHHDAKYQPKAPLRRVLP